MKKKPFNALFPFVVMYGVCTALWLLLCVVDAVNAANGTGSVEIWKVVCAAVLGAGFLVLLLVYCIGRKKS